MRSFQDKTSRVRAALAGLAAADPTDVAVDESGISSGCPEAYIDVFRFLLQRFWNVIGDDFVRAQSSHASKSSAATAGGSACDNPATSIDLLLGLVGSKRNIGLAFRRVVRFNREMLGMNTLYLLEAQFVRPNGFRERKMDMVLDMIASLRRRAEKGGECGGGHSNSSSRSGSSGSNSSRSMRADGVDTGEEVVVPGAPQHLAARAELVHSRAGLPDHVLQRRCALEGADTAPYNTHGANHDAKHSTTHNPLFTLTDSFPVVSPMSSISNLSNLSNLSDIDRAMPSPAFGDYSLDFLGSGSSTGTSCYSEDGGDAPDAIRAHDDDDDDDDDDPVRHEHSLIDALARRVSSVRHLLVV